MINQERGREEEEGKTLHRGKLKESDFFFDRSYGGIQKMFRTDQQPDQKLSLPLCIPRLNSLGIS